LYLILISELLCMCDWISWD